MAKTILAENANSSNQARLFSFVGITWGVGNICNIIHFFLSFSNFVVVGPFLGGVLSQPCTQYKIDEHSLVCYFPFLLPNYANCILITIAILIVVVAIPPPPPTQLLSDEHSTINDTNHDSKKLFKKRAIWIACSIYALVSLTWSVFEEVFPLWSFTNGFSARQLGTKRKENKAKNKKKKTNNNKRITAKFWRSGGDYVPVDELPMVGRQTWNAYGSPSGRPLCHIELLFCLLGLHFVQYWVISSFSPLICLSFFSFVLILW